MSKVYPRWTKNELPLTVIAKLPSFSQAKNWLFYWQLRETQTQVKRMERYVEKLEDERSMLVKDYEILRQSHNRKEHQLQGYTTERAELLRRLDILEYEKQQLELQLMDPRRKDRSSTYRSST